MNLQHRIDLLVGLGEYILSDDPDWNVAKERANLENGWFTPEFIDLAVNNIAREFLERKNLEDLVNKYSLDRQDIQPKRIGIVMAGNIPLVGFHDWLCVFISGNIACVKTSSKDKTLITHIVGKITEWDPVEGQRTQFAEMLKGCDAYIATGSNNTSRYFEYYFGKYPHIIRRNRTSAGVLTGNENKDQLEKLSDDVFQYFGLGCRNVTKIYVPPGYDFTDLLETFKKYDYLMDHHKYKNNYDYNLALLLLNKSHYLTNGSVLLTENPALFSPISQLNFEYYHKIEEVKEKLEKSKEIQCVTGNNFLPFGKAQCPSILEYADKSDTMEFLTNL